MGIFSKLFGGLKKTKDAISSKLSMLFHGELDDDFFEELEYVLISSDMGATAAEEIIENVKKLAKKQKVKTEDDFKKLLKESMKEVLDIEREEEDFPTLITFVGVNGVGKTTSIAKLSNIYKNKETKFCLLRVTRLGPAQENS